MRRSIQGLLQAAVLTGAITLAGTADAAPEFKLRWGHYLTNSPFVKVEQDFAETIKERTNGRVEIEIAYAGALGKGPEVLTLAGRGAIDMASVVPGYYADQLLFWKAFQIPFVFKSPKQAIEISGKSIAELAPFKEELDKMNVHFLFHQPLGEYYFTGPSAECDTVAALNGKKIRTFGADIPKALNAAGAVPVTIGVTDIYEALQRGALDYSFINRGNILSNRLYEVGKYNCGPIMSISGHLIVIGNRTWSRLPADIQKIFMEESAKSQVAYVEQIDKLETDAQGKIEAAGGVFKPFPAAEMAKWKAATPDLLNEWAKSLESRGQGEAAAKVEKQWKAWIGN